MTKNKMVRVAEKHWIDDESGSPVRYVLIGTSWHTTISAAKKYYSQRHNAYKKDLEVCDQAVSICYSPLFPRIAKKS